MQNKDQLQAFGAIWIPSVGILVNELDEMINVETLRLQNKISIPDVTQHIKSYCRKIIQDNWSEQKENK